MTISPESFWKLVKDLILRNKHTLKWTKMTMCSVGWANFVAIKLGEEKNF